MNLINTSELSGEMFTYVTTLKRKSIVHLKKKLFLALRFLFTFSPTKINIHMEEFGGNLVFYLKILFYSP